MVAKKSSIRTVVSSSVMGVWLVGVLELGAGLGGRELAEGRRGMASVGAGNVGARGVLSAWNGSGELR